MIRNKIFYELEVSRNLNTKGRSKLLGKLCQFQTFEDFWPVMMNNVLPFLYQNARNRTWHFGKAEFQSNSIVNKSGSSFILIGARLRQERNLPRDCRSPDFLVSIIPNCYQENDSNHLLSSLPQNSNYSTEYTNSNSLLERSNVVELQSELLENFELMENLSKSNWIDELTRLVDLEFLTFTPSTQLFTLGSCQMLKQAAGISYLKRLNTLRLSSYDFSNGNATGLVKIFLAIALLLFAAKSLIILLKDSKNSTSGSFGPADLLVSVIGILLTLLMVIRNVLSLHAEKLIKQKPTGYLDLLNLCRLDLTLQVLGGIVPFLALFRILQKVGIHHKMHGIFSVYHSNLTSLMAIFVQAILLSELATRISNLIEPNSAEFLAIFSSLLPTSNKAAFGKYEIQSLENSAQLKI